jgi:hypothetical protein
LAVSPASRRRYRVRRSLEISQARPKLFLRVLPKKVFRGDVVILPDPNWPHQLDETLQGKSQNDFVVSQSSSAFDKAQIPYEAIVAAAHAAKGRTSEMTAQPRKHPQ